MEIKPKFEFVTGSFNTDDCEMVCVPRWKYASVDLCIKSDNGNWNIPVGEIKLYDSEKFVDARETFEDAEAFGTEIARRWNAVAKENARLKEEAYKDEELAKMKERYDRMSDDYYRGFPISEKEAEKIHEWQDKLLKEHPGNAGAIGGRFRYEFIPTGIGVAGTVIDSFTGEKLQFQELG